MAKASTRTGSPATSTRTSRSANKASSGKAPLRASAAADAETVTEQAATTVDTLVAQVGDKLREAGIDPQRVLTAARDQAGEVQEKMAEEVKTNPLRTLGIAAAAGLVVGYLSTR
ncbi:glycine zipper domain-containing protein [Phreatobacter sp.]|uniref:glycine zipper domain-containing protein n=1 Tax=Phreatobacter sp. TaxID=1966341 RepID=UPI003F6EBA6A